MSNKLLLTIREIGESLGEIKSFRMSDQEVVRLEVEAREVRAGKFRLDVKTLENVQGRVVEGLMDNPAHGGALRRAPVIIRYPGKVDGIVFNPPDSQDVRKLTSEVLRFIQANIGKIDAIILAGIFHRQCVIIHPFIDGNGRTTRLLTTAILGKAGQI